MFTLIVWFHLFHHRPVEGPMVRITDPTPCLHYAECR